MKRSILILLLLISINTQTNGCNLEKDENKNIITFVNDTISDDIIIGNLSYIEKKIWTLANNDSSVCDFGLYRVCGVFLPGAGKAEEKRGKIAKFHRLFCAKIKLCELYNFQF